MHHGCRSRGNAELGIDLEAVGMISQSLELGGLGGLGGASNGRKTVVMRIEVTE